MGRRGQLHPPRGRRRRRNPVRVHPLRHAAGPHGPGRRALRVRVRRRAAHDTGDQPPGPDLGLHLRSRGPPGRGDGLRRPHAAVRAGRGRRTDPPYDTARRGHHLRAGRPGPHAAQGRGGRGDDVRLRTRQAASWTPSARTRSCATNATSWAESRRNSSTAGPSPTPTTLWAAAPAAPPRPAPYPPAPTTQRATAPRSPPAGTHWTSPTTRRAARRSAASEPRA